MEGDVLGIAQAPNMWHREDLEEKVNSLNQNKEENYRQYEFQNHRSDKDQQAPEMI